MGNTTGTLLAYAWVCVLLDPHDSGFPCGPSSKPQNKWHVVHLGKWRDYPSQAITAKQSNAMAMLVCAETEDVLWPLFGSWVETSEGT